MPSPTALHILIHEDHAPHPRGRCTGRYLLHWPIVGTQEEREYDGRWFLGKLVLQQERVFRGLALPPPEDLGQPMETTLISSTPSG